MRGRLPKLRTSSLPAFYVQLPQRSCGRRGPLLTGAHSSWHSFECELRAIAPLQPSRSFSVTSVDLGRSKKQKRENKIKKTTLPWIPKTNNEELNEYLDKLNRNVFQVDHIPARYRKLVLNPALHGVLQPSDEPDGSSGHVTLTIDGQLVPLVPVLEPTKRKQVGRVLVDTLKMCKHPSDYDVFPQLIDGMTYSKLQIADRQWAKLVRALGMVGRSGIVITISHGGIKERRNHFPGGNRDLVREMFRGLLVRFLLPDGEKMEGSKRPMQYNECTRALNRADVMMDIIRFRPQYKGKVVDAKYRQNSDGTVKYDPTINGTILYMNASVCKRYRDGKDGQGAVLGSVAMVKRCWGDAKTEIEQYIAHVESPPKATPKASPDLQKEIAVETATGETDLDVPSSEYNETERKDFHIARHALVDYEPLLKGLQLARDILPSSVETDKKRNADPKELLAWVNEQIPPLEAAVERWREVAHKQGGHYTGFQIYEKAAEELHLLREGTREDDRVGDWWMDTRPPPVNMHGKLVETDEADETLAKTVMKK